VKTFWDPLSNYWRPMKSFILYFFQNWEPRNVKTFWNWPRQQLKANEDKRRQFSWVFFQNWGSRNVKTFWDPLSNYWRPMKTVIMCFFYNWEPCNVKTFWDWPSNYWRPMKMNADSFLASLSKLKTTQC